MFARPVNRTPDMIKHHEYLKDIAEKVEQGQYRHTYEGYQRFNY